MKLEYFDERPKGPELLNVANSLRESSNDILESEKAGFAFPVPKEVRDLNPEDKIEVGEGLSSLGKVELFKVLLKSLREAWEKEIVPRISNIRSISPENMKEGTDFFTEADISSEKRIRDMFMDVFGEKNIRVFGEEAGIYIGNVESKIGVRIDPVDGTESMKYGKSDWGIQVGIYTGNPENEELIMAAMFYPEKSALVYYIKEVGALISDLELTETKKVEKVEPQDNIKDIIIHIWEHSDSNQRGNTEELRKRLTDKKARLRSTASSCADALEAFLTRGKRVFIIDGDYSEVDFIPASILEKIGYKVYRWDGELVSADDIKLKNQKLIIIPPGKAGEEVLDAVKGL